MQICVDCLLRFRLRFDFHHWAVSSVHWNANKRIKGWTQWDRHLNRNQLFLFRIIKSFLLLFFPLFLSILSLHFNKNRWQICVYFYILMYTHNASSPWLAPDISLCLRYFFFCLLFEIRRSWKRHAMLLVHFIFVLSIRLSCSLARSLSRFGCIDGRKFRLIFSADSCIAHSFVCRVSSSHRHRYMLRLACLVGNIISNVLLCGISHCIYFSLYSLASYTLFESP